MCHHCTNRGHWEVPFISSTFTFMFFFIGWISAVKDCKFWSSIWELFPDACLFSLRKQPTFGDTTIGFPAKLCLRNEHRNSILMTHHYPDLTSACDWLNQISHAAWPIKSTTQIWVVIHHQCGISALISQMSFGRETSGSVAKCRLFSQATVCSTS